MNDSTTPLRKLIEALYLRTLDRKIPWVFLQAADTCEAPLGEGYVQVVKEADDDGDYYSYVRLLNKDKQVVENIYGGTLGQNNRPANTGHKDYWELMNDLRSIAQRAAVGADTVVNSMLKTLDADDIDLNDVPF